jgi:hypothetical protein
MCFPMERSRLLKTQPTIILVSAAAAAAFMYVWYELHHWDWSETTIAPSAAGSHVPLDKLEKKRILLLLSSSLAR